MYSDELLHYIACRIARQYDLTEPAAVHWATLSDCWGESDSATRVVRISTDLAEEFDSVIGAVIYHELLHLTIDADCDSLEFCRAYMRCPHAVDVAYYLAGRIPGNR